MKRLIIITLGLFIFSCSKTRNPEKDTKIIYDKGIVEPFAPELFSKLSNVRDFTITNDESEAYFTLQSHFRELSVIMSIHKEDEKWQTPKIVEFSGKFSDLEPFLSPDGLKLFFVSNRPISKDSTATKDYDIWYVERENFNSNWSAPINVGAPINTNLDEFFPSITSSNNLYFTTIKENMNGQDDIFVSEWKNNVYSEPIAIDSAVNTKGAEFNAFVAPDESFILFSGWRRKDGQGSGDLYISQRKNGKWLPAKNLGKHINSKYMEYCPYVNLETNTLYFTSRRSNIRLKDSGYVNLEELKKEINRFDNGTSRIYKTGFNISIEKY
ncbi:hypothetical protein [uncultured Psychroserpens sp.]|uniref:hypothetical protein n=1 Tax=uncultured Psychroserpens sp. TaxID=255436 RepID=UPI00263971B2|nr:hypothetical protein [uncultured Psychroserpens sp.]